MILDGGELCMKSMGAARLDCFKVGVNDVETLLLSLFCFQSLCQPSLFFAQALIPSPRTTKAREKHARLSAGSQKLVLLMFFVSSGIADSSDAVSNSEPIQSPEHCSSTLLYAWDLMWSRLDSSA